MLRSISQRHVTLFVVWTLRVLALALIAVWVGYAYDNRKRLELLKLQIEQHLKEDAQMHVVVQEQLDAFYRTLYTDPDLKPKPPPAPPRQPSVVELWQRNRDKELRDRINRLENWRLRIDRELRDFER